MCHAHKFPQTTLKHLAQCVGEKPSAQLAAASKKRPKIKIELAETFQVWFLDYTAILRPNARLSELADRTDYWHHQIKYNRQAKEYALSRTFGPGLRDWQIRAVMSSVLAQEIDNAIAWIDAQETKGKIEGDPLACLLSIPAYHMTAVWLWGKKEDTIVIVDQPISFKLKKRRLYKGYDLDAASTGKARTRDSRSNPATCCPGQINSKRSNDELRADGLLNDHGMANLGLTS